MRPRADDVDDLADFDEMMRAAPAAVAHRRPAPERRRARVRSGLIALTVVLLVAGGAGGYAIWALNAPLAHGVLTVHRPMAQAGPAAEVAQSHDAATAISVAGAESYLGTDGSDIWSASGGDEPRSLASVTKLITALVVLDAYPIDTADGSGATLTFDRDDHALYDEYYVRGATLAAMPVGSTMSQRDAIATMLIPSASNYAEALARWAFGSTGAFARAAQTWLDAHGLTSTRVVEPTGFDPRNVSTPGDLIELGRLAAAHPVVSQIVATPSIDLPSTGPLYNTNDLLGDYGVTGMKTGTLEGAGSNLLYSAQLEVGLDHPLSIIGVELGGATHDSVNADVAAVLQSIQAGFQRLQVVSSGTVAGSIDTAWGSSAALVYGTAGSLTVWSDTPVTAEVSTTTPVTWGDGEVVGSTTWAAGPDSVTVPIVIQGHIEQPDAWWRLTHPGELG